MKNHDVVEVTTTTTTVYKKATAVPTLVTLVVDKSGSMQGMQDQVISNINEYIDNLKSEEGECWVTLTTFDTQFENVFVATPLNEVPVITTDHYTAGGMTALYDGLGHAVTDSEKRLKAEKGDRKSLCVIITDGYENSSREYTNDAIKKLIAKKETEGWSFVYLGAGIDSMAGASSIGIAIDPSTGASRSGFYANFTAGERGYESVTSNLSVATSRFRSTSYTGDSVLSEEEVSNIQEGK